ncbi:3-hydroxyisobutyrate dehydrogenase [Sphingomonas sp. Leaf208]|uniref:3-hydroxyisobutyrate dehydrogenase n=1 Tax=Sphingomonas sp. Leaf208 TaxID=1735679 RepID=UPI0012E1F72C|nr:3-hydroxyisobutyrate dehydrogenase [Sphingomonas sp. Leaf208]
MIVVPLPLAGGARGGRDVRTGVRSVRANPSREREGSKIRRENMARIGFIGLGNMGGGMAANLAKKGHDVRAFDLSVDALDKAKAAGCLPVASAQDAADGAEAIVTMLPAGKHVAEVYDALFAVASPSVILIDCSTIDVATAKQVATAAQAKGLVAVDAPVSGGIGAANAGTLTFMVGGSAEAFDRAQAILADMGKAVIHAGANGAGQAAKICNNMILGATMIATCEAFVLAEKLGLDAQAFYDIASVSSGQSWSMTTYAPLPGIGPETPADHDYQGGFAAALMLKDLRLAMAAAKDTGADTPMGAKAAERYEAFAEAGQGGLDFSAIIRTL